MNKLTKKAIAIGVGVGVVVLSKMAQLILISNEVKKETNKNEQKKEED